MWWSRIRQYLGSQDLNYGFVTGYQSVVRLNLHIWICLFKSKHKYQKIFRSKKQGSQGLMGFKEFVTEDSDAVISQIRQIRDQMRVIRMKRLLAKEKVTLKSMEGEKAGTGINKHRYR